MDYHTYEELTKMFTTAENFVKIVNEGIIDLAPERGNKDALKKRLDQIYTEIIPIYNKELSKIMILPIHEQVKHGMIHNITEIKKILERYWINGLQFLSRLGETKAKEHYINQSNHYWEDYKKKNEMLLSIVKENAHSKVA